LAISESQTLEPENLLDGRSISISTAVSTVEINEFNFKSVLTLVSFTKLMRRNVFRAFGNKNKKKSDRWILLLLLIRPMVVQAPLNPNRNEMNQLNATGEYTVSPL
jgi:hypothetical protein